MLDHKLVQAESGPKLMSVCLSLFLTNISHRNGVPGVRESKIGWRQVAQHFLFHDLDEARECPHSKAVFLKERERATSLVSESPEKLLKVYVESNEHHKPMNKIEPET